MSNEITLFVPSSLVSFAGRLKLWWTLRRFRALVYCPSRGVGGVAALWFSGAFRCTACGCDIDEPYTGHLIEP